MKIRNGFVTNSSSSNFILAFKDEKEYNLFKRVCEESCYEEVFDIIENCRLRTNFEETYKETEDDDFEFFYETPKNQDEVKKEILKQLKHWYIFDLKYKIMSEKFVYSDYSNHMDYVNAQKAYEETEEFQTLIEKFLQESDYYEKEKEILEANIVVSGTVWDTSGGVLEWAFRNGFLEQNFRKWTIHVKNIG